MIALASRTRPAATSAWLVLGITLVVAVLIASAVAELAVRPLLANGQPEARVEAFALKWFAEMQAGKIDRAQLAANYNAQLTDAAVQGMSQYLKDHDYGAPPRRAEVIRARKIASQTFYEVKLVFARGDAASLLFGFNSTGKITGVSLLGMAGD